MPILQSQYLLFNVVWKGYKLYNGQDLSPNFGVAHSAQFTVHTSFTFLQDLKGHTDTVTSLVWGDSRLLCSGSMDGTVRVWDVGVGENEAMETYPIGSTILGANFTETNTLVVVAQDAAQISRADS